MRKGRLGCLRIATFTILPCALITGVQSLPQAKLSHSAESEPCCSIVVQALRDYGHLKVGIKRSEVEKAFQHSGGCRLEPRLTTYTKSAK